MFCYHRLIHGSVLLADLSMVCCRLIYGFISKDEAKNKLRDAPLGSFLLRFSESNIENSQRSDISGVLTLAVMELDPKTGSLTHCIRRVLRESINNPSPFCFE